MKINKEEAYTIIEMGEYCYSEGLLDDDMLVLIQKVLIEYPDMRDQTWLPDKLLDKVS